MRLSLIALLVPCVASAYELKTDHTGSDVRLTGPLHFTVDAKLDTLLNAPGATDAVKSAASTWSAAGIDITTEVGDVSGGNDIITAITEDWPYDDGVMAVTLLTLDVTDHTIMRANIFINAAQNHFHVLAADSHRGGGFADVQNTVTHEMGHALGLAHVMDHPEAVMFPMAYDGDVDKRTLSSDNLAGVTALYPQGLIAADAPQVGCSVSGAPAWLAALLALVAVARVRRARAMHRAV